MQVGIFTNWLCVRLVRVSRKSFLQQTLPSDGINWQRQLSTVYRKRFFDRDKQGGFKLSELRNFDCDLRLDFIFQITEIVSFNSDDFSELQRVVKFVKLPQFEELERF